MQRVTPHVAFFAVPVACCAFGVLFLWRAVPLACCACGVLCLWRAVRAVPVACGACGVLCLWRAVPVACCACGVLCLWRAVPVACCACGMLCLWRVAAWQEEPLERRRSPEVVEAVKYSPECLTVTFNIARLRESEKHYQEAMLMYSAITQRCPDYVACAFGPVPRAPHPLTALRDP